MVEEANRSSSIPLSEDIIDGGEEGEKLQKKSRFLLELGGLVIHMKWQAYVRTHVEIPHRFLERCLYCSSVRLRKPALTT